MLTIDSTVWFVLPRMSRCHVVSGKDVCKNVSYWLCFFSVCLSAAGSRSRPSAWRCINLPMIIITSTTVDPVFLVSQFTAGLSHCYKKIITLHPSFFSVRACNSA